MGGNVRVGDPDIGLMGRMVVLSELPPYARLLLAVRESRGWSQAEMARELCVRRATVSDWERGRSQPHPGWMLRIRSLAPELRVTIDAQIEANAWLELEAQSGRLSEADVERLANSMRQALVALLRTQQPAERAA